MPADHMNKTQVYVKLFQGNVCKLVKFRNKKKILLYLFAEPFLSFCANPCIASVQGGKLQSGRLEGKKVLQIYFVQQKHIPQLQLAEKVKIVVEKKKKKKTTTKQSEIPF